jgi:Phosphatase
MPLMSQITLSQARAALAAGGIVGPHQSHTRQNSISKIRALVEGRGDDDFGLSRLQDHSAQEVLGWLAELTGCSTDVEDVTGCDVMDPDRAVAAIVRAAQRLRTEAQRGALLLATTGHPTGMLEHHMRVVDAYRKAGGKLLHLREDENLGGDGREMQVRYVGSVGCLSDWGTLRHTHSSTPMERLLEAQPWPEIVIGDHGFAGAAIERGIPTIAVMDINDPALAVAWARGGGFDSQDVLIIPMDDNRLPRSYEPSWRLFEQILAGWEPA